MRWDTLLAAGGGRRRGFKPLNLNPGVPVGDRATTFRIVQERPVLDGAQDPTGPSSGTSGVLVPPPPSVPLAIKPSEQTLSGGNHAGRSRTTPPRLAQAALPDSRLGF